MNQAKNEKQSRFQILKLEERIAPSADGTALGFLNKADAAAGVNIGQTYCSIEKGDCAADVHELIHPPGQS